MKRIPFLLLLFVVNQLIFCCESSDPVYKKVKGLIEKNDVDGVRTLVSSEDEDFDVNKPAFPNLLDIKNSASAFQFACRKNRLQIAKILHEKDARINQKDSDGETALHIAAQEGHAEIFKWLVSEGADIEAKEEMGDTPVDFVETLDIVKFLMEEKESLLRKHQYRIFENAIHHDLVETVAFLIEKGIDVRKKGICRYGDNYPFFAFRLSRREIFSQFLAKYGEDSIVEDIAQGVILHFSEK